MGRRLLPLVALVVAIVPAAASAAPALKPGPDEYPAISRTNDVPIVMRDGVKLFADIHRPATADGKPAPGRFPVVLTQTPYNKAALGNVTGGSGVATLAGVSPLLVKHGYVHVIVDVRGTGESEGNWDSFGPQEQQDGFDLATWLHDQPWSNGELALYGASYMAINQFLTAAQHPPGLKAMFPIIPSEDIYRDVTWHGGNVDAGFIPLWLGLVTGLKMIPPNYLGTDPAQATRTLLQRVTGGLQFPAQSVLDLAVGGDLAYDGPFYRVRSPGTVAGEIDVPTFVVGGWWDLFQRGEPRLYSALKMAPGRKQLLMGPWYHITAGDGLGAEGAPPALDALALAWFDRWVKGVANHVEDFGPVTLYELGTKKWQTQSSWPDRGVRWERFYLRAGKTLSTDPPTAPAVETVLANPINGLCSRSTAQWTAGLLVPGASCTDDNRMVEASGLTHTTAPVTEPLRVNGPLALTLRASTAGARDTTWIATLADVSPDGKSNPITSGWLMPSRRALADTRSVRAANGDVVQPFHPFTRESLLPVVSGRPETLNIELFPTDLVVQPGHRLRLALTHGDLPHMLTTGPDTLTTLGAIDRVHIDPARPSFLSLPVVHPVPEPALKAKAKHKKKLKAKRKSKARKRGHSKRGHRRHRRN